MKSTSAEGKKETTRDQLGDRPGTTDLVGAVDPAQRDMTDDDPPYTSKEAKSVQGPQR